MLGLYAIADVIHDRSVRLQLGSANERIEHLQFEVKTLTHTVGEVYQERAAGILPADSSTLPTNIIFENQPASSDNQ